MALGLWGLLIAGGQGLAQELATNSQPTAAVTTYLDYRESGFSFTQWSLPVSSRSAAFKKEPSLSRNSVVRGMLHLGGGATNEMGFAWDRAAGKLYLDLNRNLDLTDDPAGAFASQNRSGMTFQGFSGVHLPLSPAAGDCQALVDLNFTFFGQLSCSVGMRSFWQGKVTLQGEEWQMGLLANPFEPRSTLESGSLLLRPWGERNRNFDLYGGSLEAFTFSRKLFVGNHAYELRCTREGQGSAGKVRVQFTEQQPILGQLRIAGDFLQRVTLEPGPYTVVLDKPEGVVRVPVGGYGPTRVCLRKGDAEAHMDGRRQSGASDVLISERKAAVLPAGGPLTNSVTVSRQGKNLYLNYQLLGAGGTYELANADRSHPPEFTVYQGDKKIGSGKFQYG